MKFKPSLQAIAVAAIILLLVPIAAWISGWHWQNQIIENLSSWILLTDTASLPLGIGTIVVFCGLLFTFFRKSITKKTALFCLVLLGMAILSGQIVKVVVKNTLKEPRPYVQFLADYNIISTDDFYGMARDERKDWLIANEKALSTSIPNQLQKHWQHEVGYSFPSGHTIFAATWALLAVGLWWPRKQYFLAAVSVVWAEFVLISRLFLGMHWPLDLLVGILISFVLALFFVLLIERQLAK